MTNEQIAMVLAAIIPSLIVGGFGLRQSIRVDKRAGETQANEFQLGSAAQAIAGLNTLVDQLQQEIDRLQKKLLQVQTEFDELQVSYETMKKGMEQLVNRIAMLSKGKTPEVHE